MRLYTFQKPGQDITKEHNPLKDYSDETGPYFRLSQYLGWPSWVWAFPSLEDFKNELCRAYMEIPKSWHLWVLDIPESKVIWVYFSRQMDNTLPMIEYFAKDQATIRTANDLPLALVRVPIDRKWVRR
jgi:hypothetical protein